MERVYVGNLPPDIRIKDIDDFFRPFGKLVYIDVNHRTNPVYAYVQFDSARNAFNAVKSRHGYDYEGYTLQLRLVENEVRKRRDATPPPPPPPMLSEFLNNSQNNRGGYNNDFGNNYNNNRMGGNFPNSSFQSGSSSQWSGNNRSNMSQQQQQNISQYAANNRANMPQQTMMDRQQQNMMPYSSNGRSNVQQNPKSNRSNMQQNNNSNRSNMTQNMNSNRSNMPQNMNSNRSNMQQNNNSNRSNMQQNMNSNRSNMQQNTNSNRSNMQNMNNYSNMSLQNMNNYSNMSQQNMNNYSNNSQQNMNNYSNANRSNMSQQQQNMNMMNYSNNNNSSWNSGNDNMGWNSGNNNYNNAAPNNMYDPSNDPYATAGFEDIFTHGLSGSGRKWFNRYIRKGFSPELARSKALEHRTVPYLRDDPTPVNPIPNDPTTNMALETIGNTILSLLSTNAGDNFNNENQMMQSFSNWGGDNFQAGNFDMPGPSSSRGRGNMVPQIASKRHIKRIINHLYTKSVGILEKIRKKKFKGSLSQREELDEKYHMQIISEYEELFMKKRAKDRLKNISNTSGDVAKEKAAITETNTYNNKGGVVLEVQQVKEPNLSKLSETEPPNVNECQQSPIIEKTSVELLREFNELKENLIQQVKPNRKERERKLSVKAREHRTYLMVQGGLREYEAKVLAVLSIEILETLVNIKREYDIKKKQEENKIINTDYIGITSNSKAPKVCSIPLTNECNDRIVTYTNAAANIASNGKLEGKIALTNNLISSVDTRRADSQNTNTSLINTEKTSIELLREYNDYKQALLSQVKLNTKQCQMKLSEDEKMKSTMLIVQGSLKDYEANMLAKLPLQILQKLLDMKRVYELKKSSENPLCKEKSSNDFLKDFEDRKKSLLKQAKPNPKENQKKLSIAAKNNRKMLILQGGLSEYEATTLAVLKLKILYKLLDVKRTYKIKKKQEIDKYTRTCSINTTTIANSETTKTQQNDNELHTATTATNFITNLSNEATNAETQEKRSNKVYNNYVNFLKLFENRDVTTLRQSTIIRLCLKGKREIEKQHCLPFQDSHFDYLLNDKIVLTGAVNKKDANIFKKITGNNLEQSIIKYNEDFIKINEDLLTIEQEISKEKAQNETIVENVSNNIEQSIIRNEDAQMDTNDSRENANIEISNMNEQLMEVDYSDTNENIKDLTQPIENPEPPGILNLNNNHVFVESEKESAEMSF